MTLILLLSDIIAEIESIMKDLEEATISGIQMVNYTPFSCEKEL
jgi:hypothetical protein